jgi:hypothetical protein
MVVIAINTLLWLLGGALYFTGTISGAHAVILGIVVQVSLVILIRSIRFNLPSLRFFLEPRPFYPGYRER